MGRSNAEDVVGALPKRIADGCRETLTNEGGRNLSNVSEQPEREPLTQIWAQGRTVMSTTSLVPLWKCEGVLSSLSDRHRGDVSVEVEPT